MSIHRNMGMELVRVTEAAALAASSHLGRGDGKAADQAAVDAMRLLLDSISMDGVVVIGEGEKDEAPRLYNGERIGTGEAPELDLAVDPVEGTRLLALGRPNAIAVIAAAPRGAFWNPGPSLYTRKIAVGHEARDAIDLGKSPTENLQAIARALGRGVETLTVFILDKPRHIALVEEVRAAGARVTLHTDGDVMGALLAAVPGAGVDVLMGTGGTPEAVIAATAVKALGGGMQCQVDPQSEVERAAVVAHGDPANLDEVLTLDRLVSSDDAFFAATAITDSPFLPGVRTEPGLGVTTHSLVIRARSGSLRFIRGVHRMNPGHIFRAATLEAAVEAANL
ncbi:MAG: class II fructose-bisphosphatase [Gemmatimonadota bacterium]